MASTASGSVLRISEVLSALSYGLDLTEGQPPGHAIRCTVIGMRIAEELGLDLEDRSRLYYALLLKDAGCSTNASKMFQMLGTDEISAKRDVKTTDWTRAGWDSLQYALSHLQPNANFLNRMRALFDMAQNHRANGRALVQVRCERGADIARRIGLPEETAQAIYSLDELWNGKGHPRGLRGEEIPLLSRIMNLAQNLDVFFVVHGESAARAMAERRSGRWFDPEIVKAFQSVLGRGKLWAEVRNSPELATKLEPGGRYLEATPENIDNICLAFADVIDAKSPFTYQHSIGVAAAASRMAETLDLPAAQQTMIRRAALLHDIGKLSVPNSILDKPGKLSHEDWNVVKRHPHHTYQILRRIPGFDELSDIAASHHERLDGSGYFRHRTGDQMSVPARILVVADIFDALHAKRPYRDALPEEQVFSIMERDAPEALDAECLAALKQSSNRTGSVAEDLQRLAQQIPAATAKGKKRKASKVEVS